MPKALSKMDIVQIKDQVVERVDVPEWGGVVCVRSISAAERGRIEADAAKYRESKGKDMAFARTFTVRIAAEAMCDESGARLFSDSETGLLAEKNAAAIARVAEVAQRLSGFTKTDLDGLEKNSETAQADASLSA